MKSTGDTDELCGAPLNAEDCSESLCEHGRRAWHGRAAFGFGVRLYLGFIIRKRLLAKRTRGREDPSPTGRPRLVLREGPEGHLMSIEPPCESVLQLRPVFLLSIIHSAAFRPSTYQSDSRGTIFPCTQTDNEHPRDI